VYPDAGGAAEMESIVVTALKVHERSAGALIGAVMPGVNIGRRTGKHPRGHSQRPLMANIRAIDGVKTGRPGKIQASDPSNPPRSRIVVVQLHCVGLVEGLFNGW